MISMTYFFTAWILGEYATEHRCRKCPVYLCHEYLNTPDLPEMPQAHEALARKGYAGPQISVHRL